MKNKKQKKILTPYRQEMRKISMMISVFMWAVAVTAVVLCWLDWKYGLYMAIFGVWSAYWYRHGRYAQVVDVYEHDGYPDDGLRCMLKSWVTFGVLSAIGYAVYYAYGVNL